MMEMMTISKKTRTRYGHSNTRWTRKEAVDWVRSKKCPECGQKRLFPGPDYDRFKVICLQCGNRFAIKPPEDAVR